MHWITRLTLKAFAAALVLGVGACAAGGYPKPAEMACGVAGLNCRPECRAIPMPSPSADPNAVSYHIGPASCPARYIRDARSQARQACRDRGLSLASAEAQVAQQPPADGLPASESATFLCQK